MANIITVRELTQNLRQLIPGQTYVVVDGVRKKIIVTLQAQQSPEQIEQVITKVFRR